MVRHLGRVAWVPVLAVSLMLLAAPAHACGCGAVLPRNGDASVSQERAFIRWNGRTEDIVMELSVHGTSQEAAWILPVPAPATVKLADPALFRTLDELTKPRVEYTFQPIFVPGMAGGAAPPPPVTVLERQTLGPFDVSTLAAQDATALSDWLAANGYTFPPQLARVLQYYVAQSWFFVAVKLTSTGTEQALTGTLDPLWVTFESAEMIYPMRPSKLARSGLGVTLYVLADHRVNDPVGTNLSFGNYSNVTYADWIDPATLAQTSPLKPLVERKQFLTKIEASFRSPFMTINNDYTFSFAPTDTPYYTTDTRNIYWGNFLCLGVLAWSLMLGIRSMVRAGTKGGAQRRKGTSTPA